MARRAGVARAVSARRRSLVVGCAAASLISSLEPAVDARRPGRPYHPAPRIVVDVVQAQGALAGAELQRVARSSGYWPFRRCYEDGLRRDQRLKGKVVLEVVVAEDGSVESSAAMTASTLADDAVVACVAQEAQRLSFATDEAPTTATLSVALSPGDEPVPPAPR